MDLSKPGSRIQLTDEERVGVLGAIEQRGHTILALT